MFTCCVYKCIIIFFVKKINNKEKKKRKEKKRKKNKTKNNYMAGKWPPHTFCIYASHISTYV